MVLTVDFNTPNSEPPSHLRTVSPKTDLVVDDYWTRSATDDLAAAQVMEWAAVSATCGFRTTSASASTGRSPCGMPAGADHDPATRWHGQQSICPEADDFRRCLRAEHGRVVPGGRTGPPHAGEALPGRTA